MTSPLTSSTPAGNPYASVLHGIPKHDLKALMEAITHQYGRDDTEMALMVSKANAGGNPFDQSTVCCTDLPSATEIERLWGFCIYPGKVHLIIGETGAGKSSFLYNFVVCAATNAPLWGVPFEGVKPLKVLYIDPENYGSNSTRKLERLGRGRPSGLFFNPGDAIDLSDRRQVAALTEHIIRMQFDLVVLDPIAQIFNTVNENDNSEAQRQMNSLTRMSRQTNVAIIAVHHTDKNAQSAYGRGASSRLAAADVAITLRSRGSDETDDTFRGETHEREDLVRFQCVKNRLEGRGSLFLQMAGNDSFLPSSFAAWQDATAKNPNTEIVPAAKEEIHHCMADGLWRTKPEILSALALEGFGQAATDLAVKELIANGTLIKRYEHGAQRMILSAYLAELPPSAQTGGEQNYGGGNYADWTTA